MSSDNAPDRTAWVVTAAIGGGLLLTTLPLRSVFTDWNWLAASIVCSLPYWLVVATFRTRSAAVWWHSLIGLAASALVLLWIFVPQNLAFGVIPTPASAGDIKGLIDDSRRALQGEHAPLASTPALRFMTAGLLSLLAALTDILGVGLRRPLLAAAPMIEILAVASTTSSRPASPIWFIAAAAGFLLIVLASTRLQDEAWGPAVDGSLGRMGGVRTIAVIGIAAALLVPVLIPGRSVNLIAKATHHSATGGAGGSGQIVLNDFAKLQGQLKRGTPTDLLKVQVDRDSKPFYIRQSVLDAYNDQGWFAAAPPSGSLTDLQNTDFQVQSATGLDSVPTNSIDATFTVLALGGTEIPILANPGSLSAVISGSWDSLHATVQGPKLTRGLTYTEHADQPAPSKEQLLAAPSDTVPIPGIDYVGLPAQPALVSNLAAQLTAGKVTPYEKAVAISDYFTDGKDGFTYSLDAPATDGQKAIVSFLTKKAGYCQQYAAAAAVLMREAGLPTRVVLGYTHSAPDRSGIFTVTTLDAHAWVETYFSGTGWVAFDPTPLSGTDAGRAVALTYAPHSSAAPSQSGVSTAPSRRASTSRNAAPRDTSAASAGLAAKTGHHGLPGVLVALFEIVSALLVLLLLLAAPRLVRRGQRRRRLADALRTGTAEPLWQELAASAQDQGALWPDTVTVRQVPAWLGRHGLDERGTLAVTALAERMAENRFSSRASSGLTDNQISGIDEALHRWGRRAERRQRLLYRWVPRSLISKTDRSQR